MSATEQPANGHDPSSEKAGTSANGSADSASRPSGNEAQRARAYLDLWERHLVHAAVRTRHGPRAQPPAGWR